ncbi:unnamed protein product [Spirodela intermedia]|uniref:Uncharacterized protein n=1 Tax=Spirodela intermedia TaxID=51605 RepID=A0A7I8JKP1_SPIIN|nr:unnamed protein product [Spirodela intermedia]CAA6670757.1 unnamed protein product [Spirodela intermedia]
MLTLQHSRLINLATPPHSPKHTRSHSEDSITCLI